MVIKARGLGRGLDALFGDDEPADNNIIADAAADSAPRGDILARKLVNISLIDRDPEQPRKHFDEAALKVLAASIKKHGLLQPILVRTHRLEPTRYSIIAGERRWRAAQLAQLHEVPIIIKELDDDQMFQVALIENLQREDLNAIEEARGYERLYDEFKHTHEEIGELIGKSRSHVANMIRLLQLPQSVQTMVNNGELTAGHARALLNAESPTLLAQEIVAKGLSVRQAEALAKKNAGANFKSHKKAAQPKDADLLALEKDLSDKLGMNVALNMADNQKGMMNIEFSSLDQLDLLLKKLG